MTEKTIPELPELTEIDELSEFIVDTGIQTYRISAENMGLFFRDNILPAGMTSPFAGGVSPDGWLLCDGSEVSRTTYAKLFLAVGVAYGIGDGSDTFNLPDLRGRVIAGKDDMGGGTAGRITNAVSGITGTTLGAVGGTQAVTHAGTIGGSQSIAHTHTMSHTHTMAHTHPDDHNHGMAHVHQWAFVGSEYYTNSAVSVNSVNIGSGDHQCTTHDSFSYVGAGADHFNSLWNPLVAGVNNLYTTGAISGVNAAKGTTGNSSDPNTGPASQSTTSDVTTANTGGMSANATVNGSNFTFTGTAGHRVQPTLIMNYIIKT